MTDRPQQADGTQWADASQSADGTQWADVPQLVVD